MAIKAGGLAKKDIAGLQAEISVAQSFVASVNLIDEEDLPLSLLTSQQRAYVDMGSLVGFVKGVTTQHKQDVLDSMLLAQAHATKHFDRENDTRNWYNSYRSVLEKVGWVINNFNFSRFSTRGSSFTMDEAVLDIIEAVASGDEYAIADEIMKGMRALKGSDGRIALFDQSSHDGRAGSFQVTPASEDGTGNVTMVAGAFYFTTRSQVTNLLWFHFSDNETELWHYTQRITLNDQVYRAVRQEIRAKVRDLARRTVREIDI